MGWGNYDEKKWRKKLPKEFQDCSEEELRRQISNLCQEFQELIKDGDCPEEILFPFIEKNESLILAMDQLNKHQLEKKIREK